MKENFQSEVVVDGEKCVELVDAWFCSNIDRYKLKSKETFEPIMQ